MKKVLLLSAIVTLSVFTFAQTRTNVPKDVREWAVERVAPTLETMNLSHDVLPSSSPQDDPEEAIIGKTYYDLQTNTSMQNRLYVYPDGTAAGVFTFGEDFQAFQMTGERVITILMEQTGELILLSVLKMVSVVDGQHMHLWGKMAKSLLPTVEMLT